MVTLEVLGGLRIGSYAAYSGPISIGKPGRCTVSARITRTDEGLVFSPPKSKAGVRVVALPTIALDALRQHQRAQAKAKTQLSSLVFCNKAGKPLERGNIERRSF